MANSIAREQFIGDRMHGNPKFRGGDAAGESLFHLEHATLKPTALLATFHAPGLEPVTREVEETIVKIMQEAAG